LQTVKKTGDIFGGSLHITVTIGKESAGMVRGLT
jgi:hypothetical protein